MSYYEAYLVEFLSLSLFNGFLFFLIRFYVVVCSYKLKIIDELLSLKDNLLSSLRWGYNWIADGREVEEEKEQDIAYKDWFSHTHESQIQQVSSKLCLSKLFMVFSVFWESLWLGLVPCHIILDLINDVMEL